MRSALKAPVKQLYASRRDFWKHRAVPKQVQPVVDQVKPIIHETLNEVYRPLLDKLTSIDEKLGKIEKYVDTYAPRVVQSTGNEEIKMVKPK